MSCENQCSSCSVKRNLDSRIGNLQKLKGTNPSNSNVGLLRDLRSSLLSECDPILAEAAGIMRRIRPVDCQSTFDIYRVAPFLKDPNATEK